MKWCFIHLLTICAGDQVTSFGLEESWGFIAGNNEFRDKEKAQLLEFTGSASFSVIGVGGFFVMPSVINDGELTAKVYMMDDGSGGPGALVSTSMPMKASEVVAPNDTSVELSVFAFGEEETPIIDYASFFASIDVSQLYASQDTVGLFHTMEGCGSGSNSWEKWADDTWHSLDSAYDPALNIDFLITAVVEFDDQTTADEYINNKGLQLFPATPNPATTRTVLNYGIETADGVEVQVFDNQGKLLRSIHHDVIPAGRHEQEILTYDFSPGAYYYRIATSKSSLISRFIVQH